MRLNRSASAYSFYSFWLALRRFCRQSRGGASQAQVCFLQLNTGVISLATFFSPCHPGRNQESRKVVTDVTNDAKTTISSLRSMPCQGFLHAAINPTKNVTSKDATKIHPSQRRIVFICSIGRGIVLYSRFRCRKMQVVRLSQSSLCSSRVIARRRVISASPYGVSDQ